MCEHFIFRIEDVWIFYESKQNEKENDRKHIHNNARERGGNMQKSAIAKIESEGIEIHVAKKNNNSVFG